MREQALGSAHSARGRASPVAQPSVLGPGMVPKHSLRAHVVQRRPTNAWLTDTGPVLWTLRPGKAAQA
ncbi:hypothetical protein [Streptomyces sp. MMS24-I29]|uniref:hypothetical protein n=1 Tax=Streptomyces sp. MMS24-I29 TaxID=3351480 RepID=UPI003C7AABF0